MANEVIDAQTGEVLVMNPDTNFNALEAQTRSEIDALVTTAKRFPRPKPAIVRDAIMELATMDETTAEEMRYALPRGKNADGTAKVISGPSIRFAEICAQQFGNCQIGTRVTAIDKKEGFCEAEGVFIDSQTNVRQVARVKRRIKDKYGKVYNDDVIQQTCNAAASIARRNAILAGVPKAIWNRAYEEAEKVITGSVETLSNTRAKAIAAFTNFGLDQDAVLELVAAEMVEDVGLEEVADLRSMFRQLKNKETTVEDLLRIARGQNEKQAPAERVHGNPMADEGPGPQKGGAPAQEPAKAEETAPAAEKAPEAEKPAEDKPAARKRATKPKEETAPAAEEATAPAAEEAKAEPTAGSDPLPVTDPKNEGEYVRYAIGWLHQLGSASEITERWKNERRLRNECGVTSETLEELTAEREKRIAAL